MNEAIQPNAETALQLTQFRVMGLFGEFNHSIDFNKSERVTALIGPNGMGKTVCLRLINALFRRQWSFFLNTEFDSVEFGFSDGRRIRATHLIKSDSETEVSSDLGVLLQMFSDKAELLDTWSPRPIEERGPRALRIESYIPFLTRTSPRIWTHDHTRQNYSFQEAIDAFGDRLPPDVVASLDLRASELIEGVITQIDCHLIETQRLLVFQADDYRGATSSSLAISKKAQTLKSIIAAELARYASTSQSLDRSFPRRVLQLDPDFLVPDLSSSLTELDGLRSGLVDAGLLVSEGENAILSSQPAEPAIAKVLSVYVEDTRVKLNELEPLRKKITLFKQLVDERFRPKYISVAKENGFEVRRGSKVRVPLDKLSSGEQHQLVLFFELLFELKDNALILIDEPELSLHVGWQKSFIFDLKRIITLNGFDVLLATHSPQLIGAWEGLVVEIGEVDP